MLKRISALVIALSMFFFSACTDAERLGNDNKVINIGILNGPTGIGALELIDRVNAGDKANYEFYIASEASDIAAKLLNGELQIGALPTNMAANLYNKTNGSVQVLAVNTAGVLYILENGSSISNLSDLKGHTVYCSGRGANPEYVLKYVLQSAGINPDRDLDLQFADPSEINVIMMNNPGSICMLPVPAVTALLLKNENIRICVDLNEEYEKANKNNSAMYMGCLVAYTDFIKDNKADIKMLLDDFKESIETVKLYPESYSSLAVSLGFCPDEEIAELAIPQCNLVFESGAVMREALQKYYSVLFTADPASIGGKEPDDLFYYEQR